jgi:tetratricopeptide (TPR) repeat protein
MACERLALGALRAGFAEPAAFRLSDNAPMTGVLLTADPRFVRAVALFNDGEYLESSDLFEELFFEGIRDEPDFIRIFLQFSVGIYHAETKQWRPAVERIEEGLRLLPNQDDRGIDLVTLANGMKGGVRSLREKSTPVWPSISFRTRG